MTTTLSRHAGMDVLVPVYDDVFSGAQCKELEFRLQYNELILGISDVGPAVWAHPGSDAAIKGLDQLLNHGDTAIPLAFSSKSSAEDVVDLEPIPQAVIGECWPGQLTVVANARMKYRKVAARLHTSGTLGVRVSRSALERQLADEAKTPITTAAVRDDDGHLVSTFDEAMDLLLLRLDKVSGPMPKITIVRGRRKKPMFAEHSTVVGLGANGCLEVFRQGAVAERELRLLSTRGNRFRYWDGT